MAISTFDGPVRSLNGFYAQGPGNTINLANNTNTATLDVATYAGKLITTSDATLALTLPTIVSTASAASAGPGTDPNTLNNIGARFRILVLTSATTFTITSGVATDLMVGSVYTGIGDNALGADVNIGSIFVPNGSTNYIFTMNGTTQGGVKGSYIDLTIVAASTWLIQGVLVATDSTLVTPFSG